MIPLDQAFRDLRKSGFNIDARLWDKLRHAGLISPAMRISGTKRYGIDQTQCLRLRHLLSVKNKIPGRFLLSRLALALALDGDSSVPPGLIRREICRRFDHHSGMVSRGMARYAKVPVRPEAVKRDDLIFAAKRAAKRWTKRLRHDYRYRVYRDTLERVTFIFLKMAYLGTSPLEDERAVRDALYEFFTYFSRTTGRVGIDDEALRKLARMLSETLDGMRLSLVLRPKKNKLYQAIESAPAEELVEIARLAPKFGEALRDLGRSIASALPSGGGKFIDAFFAEPAVKNYFEAMSVALLVSERNSDTGKEVLAKLRAGENILPEFVPQLIASIQQLITIERIRHERVATDFASIRDAKQVHRGRRLRSINRSRARPSRH